MLYYLPDQAEVDLWKSMKRKTSLSGKESAMNTKNYILLSIIFTFIIISALLGLISTFVPSIFKQPIEALLSSMLIMGCILLLGGIFIVIILNKRENARINLKDVDWNVYGLDKYQVIKSLSFGSVLFLSIYIQWNIQAYFLKFPTRIAPHSVYFFHMALAILFFFSGIQLMTKIFKERILRNKVDILLGEYSRKEFLSNVIVEIGSSFFTLLSVFLLIFISCTPLLHTVICVDRGIFGISIFLPLLIISILAFFIKI